MYSRSYSEGPGGGQTDELQLRIPRQMFHIRMQGVTTTADDRKAPARKLLRVSQRPQLLEHCCLLRDCAVPHPAVFCWTLHEKEEDR